MKPSPKRLLLGLAIVAVGATAFAAGTLFQKKGESSIVLTNEQGRVATTISTHEFMLANEWNGGGYNQTLLSVKRSETTLDGLDGLRGSVEAEAFVDGQDKFDRLAWTVKDDAQTAALTYEPSFFVTGKGGCCGSIDTYRAYDVKTGKLVLSYNLWGNELNLTKAPFSIEVPNSHPQLSRVIGVLSNDATRDFPEAANLKLPKGVAAVAVVTYATPDHALEKALVTVPVPEGWGAGVGEVELVSLTPGSKNEVRFGRLTLWDADGRGNAGALSNFGLRLKVYVDKEYTVVIPVKADRIDYANVTVSGGASVQALR